MKKLLLVINPRAGMRRANRHLTDIVEIFNRAQYDVTVYVTQFQGDAQTVTAQRAKEFDLVVCCGGDGTFNETVSGLLTSGADVPMGYIPAGSTNDFANSLGLPGNILDCARRIVSGSPAPYDIGKFNGRFFSYVASFGAFTRTSYTTPQSVKNALGHTAYLLSGIQELSQIHTEHAQLKLDGKLVEDDFLFGAICNSTSLGGVVTLDPKQVDLRDGKFEVLLVRAPKDLAEVAECIQAVQKQQYNCKMITFQSAQHIEIHARADMSWTLDGEHCSGSDHIEVENLYHAINLITEAVC